MNPTQMEKAVDFFVRWMEAHGSKQTEKDIREWMKACPDCKYKGKAYRYLALYLENPKDKKEWKEKICPNTTYVSYSKRLAAVQDYGENFSESYQTPGIVIECKLQQAFDFGQFAEKIADIIEREYDEETNHYLLNARGEEEIISNENPPYTVIALIDKYGRMKKI